MKKFFALLFAGTSEDELPGGYQEQQRTAELRTDLNNLKEKLKQRKINQSAGNY